MMTPIRFSVRNFRSGLRVWISNHRIRAAALGCGYCLSGFVLSAASLGNVPLTLTLGLVMACSPGWQLLLTALGGMGGYLLFWGQTGLQGIVWLCAGYAAAQLLAGRKLARDSPLLLPAIAGLIAAASGVAFQLTLGDDTPIALYLARVALAPLSAMVFSAAMDQQEPVAGWIVKGLAVFALSQIAPIPSLGLGFLAAGILGCAGTFPEAAMAGLALDLARVTPVPMAAVLSIWYLFRLIPVEKRWIDALMGPVICTAIMAVCGIWDYSPLPGLLLGGFAGFFLPNQPRSFYRRGETGIAQVRLEMSAGVLSQTEALLLETPEIPVDELALTQKAVSRACGSCPCRKACRDRSEAETMEADVLHRPLLTAEDLPVTCRKAGRMLMELNRAQEQLRAIRASRKQQTECREAVIQQYQFLSEYLQLLSDDLARGADYVQPRFRPEIAARAASNQAANGDRCLWFAGTGCRYYLLLCDGMGTGSSAAEESRTAGAMLRQMLSSGFPAEYALRSLNSLCALRSRAGAFTVDLAEIRLDTGKATLYKWGAAPSYLLTRDGAEKIGTAGPPPGLSLSDDGETVDRLSLRRGETLVLLSDGVGGEDALRRALESPGEPPGELAAKILEYAGEESADDATAAVVRLQPLATATQ